MVWVSAAVIYNDSGEILICQRAASDSCALLWEFPGGKQEHLETAEECLVRECREELGIEISINGLLAHTKYNYTDREIAFTFFTANIIKGIPTARVHNAIKWAHPYEFEETKFCPADVEIARMLKTRACR